VGFGDIIELGTMESHAKALLKGIKQANRCWLDPHSNICVVGRLTDTDLWNCFMHNDFSSGYVWSFRFLFSSWLKGVPYSSDVIICIILQSRKFLKPVAYATFSGDSESSTVNRDVGKILWGDSENQSLSGDLKRMFYVFSIQRWKLLQRT
jgi:hypothetical protein